MRIFMVTAACAVIASPASADNPTLNPNSAVCVTEDQLDQLESAIFKRDTAALGWLSQNGCMVSARPVKVTVLGLSSWGAKARVRMYRGSRAAEAWVLREDLKGYDPLKP